MEIFFIFLVSINTRNADHPFHLHSTLSFRSRHKERESAEFNKNVEIPFRLLIFTYNHVLDYHVRFYVYSTSLHLLSTSIHLISNGLVYQKRFAMHQQQFTQTLLAFLCMSHVGIIELTSIFTDYLSILGYLFSHHDN